MVKSKNIGGGFKIVYNDSTGTRSIVDVIVSERSRNFIAGVKRFDDHLMKIVIVSLKRRLFSAYAPLQTGCTDQAKYEFWEQISEKTAAAPPEDTVLKT
ncbi:hypothetical protein Y032_0019g3747 [Ancylostoma ceylanicum]|uniref:Uncharacterized protein n=1 Tax=Ancylostoma ceylanicum TaxID=53326 RepID=A0A016V0V5_9BILA|nr:hypothetical protein Y032_0019g3747 [Ancylostoma ceylanicum]